MALLIESHAHYSQKKFENKYPYLSYDSSSSEFTVEQAYPGLLFPAIGLHPTRAPIAFFSIYFCAFLNHGEIEF